MIKARGIYALILVKKLNTQVPIQLKEISTSTGMSITFLEQIARKLRMADILKAWRGPGGGYTLISEHTDACLILRAVDNDSFVEENRVFEKLHSDEDVLLIKAELKNTARKVSGAITDSLRELI